MIGRFGSRIQSQVNGCQFLNSMALTGFSWMRDNLPTLANVCRLTATRQAKVSIIGRFILSLGAVLGSLERKMSKDVSQRPCLASAPAVPRPQLSPKKVGLLRWVVFKYGMP